MYIFWLNQMNVNYTLANFSIDSSNASHVNWVQRISPGLVQISLGHGIQQLISSFFSSYDWHKPSINIQSFIINFHHSLSTHVQFTCDERTLMMLPVCCCQEMSPSRVFETIFFDCQTNNSGYRLRSFRIDYHSSTSDSLPSHLADNRCNSRGGFSTISSSLPTDEAGTRVENECIRQILRRQSSSSQLQTETIQIDTRTTSTPLQPCSYRQSSQIWSHRSICE